MAGFYSNVEILSENVRTGSDFTLTGYVVPFYSPELPSVLKQVINWNHVMQLQQIDMAQTFQFEVNGHMGNENVWLMRVPTATTLSESVTMLSLDYSSQFYTFHIRKSYGEVVVEELFRIQDLSPMTSQQVGIWSPALGFEFRSVEESFL